MLPFLNRYSYLLTSAAAMAAAWAVGARIGGLAAPIAVAGVGAALALVQRKLRGGASSVPNWGAVQQAIGQSVPLLLFIYSDT
jgi:hypothetical protein